MVGMNVNKEINRKKYINNSHFYNIKITAFVFK